MTTADGVVRAKQSLPARIAARTGGGVLRIVLILVGLFWLMPTVGLLVSSLRSPQDIAESGWWTVFTEPAQLTWASYGHLLENAKVMDSLLTTALITVPATVLVVVIGRWPGTRSPGWTSPGATRGSWSWSGCWWCPCRSR